MTLLTSVFYSRNKCNYYLDQLNVSECIVIRLEVENIHYIREMSLRKIKYTFASSNALLFLFLIFSIGLAEWTPAVASMPDDMVFL